MRQATKSVAVDTDHTISVKMTSLQHREGSFCNAFDNILNPNLFPTFLFVIFRSFPVIRIFRRCFRRRRGANLEQFADEYMDILELRVLLHQHFLDVREQLIRERRRAGHIRLPFLQVVVHLTPCNPACSTSPDTAASLVPHTADRWMNTQAGKKRYRWLQPQPYVIHWVWVEQCQEQRVHPPHPHPGSLKAAPHPTHVRPRTTHAASTIRSATHQCTPLWICRGRPQSPTRGRLLHWGHQIWITWRREESTWAHPARKPASTAGYGCHLLIDELPFPPKIPLETRCGDPLKYVVGTPEIRYEDSHEPLLVTTRTLINNYWLVQSPCQEASTEFLDPLRGLFPDR